MHKLVYTFIVQMIYEMIHGGYTIAVVLDGFLGITTGLCFKGSCQYKFFVSELQAIFYGEFKIK